MSEGGKAGGALLGTLFGSSSRPSVLKGALSLGLTPPGERPPAPDSRPEVPHDDRSDELKSPGLVSTNVASKSADRIATPHQTEKRHRLPSAMGQHQVVSRSPSVNPLEMQCTPMDVFSYYDRDSDGYLSKVEFARAIRAMGGCPSEKQVGNWFNDLATDEDVQLVPDKIFNPNPSPSHKDHKNPNRPIIVVAGSSPVSTKKGISCKTFTDEVPRLIHESPGPSRSDILESLKTFTVQKDNQPGFILETETIRTVLGGMGPEHLQPLEVEAMITGLEHKSGQIHFGSMLDKLSQRTSGKGKLHHGTQSGHHGHHGAPAPHTSVAANFAGKSRK